MPARTLRGLTYLGQSRDYNPDMLKNWWRKRQQDRKQQEQKDADRLTPIFKNTDWTGGRPL